MVETSGPYLAACLLLALGGGWKLRRPGPAAAALTAVGLPGSPALARLLGGGELGLGLAAAVTWSPGAAGLVALAYVAFAGFVLVARARSETTSCGCFGAAVTPPSLAHAGLDLALAAVALGVALGPGIGPAASPLFLASAVLLAWLLYLAMTELPRTLLLTRRS